MNCKSAFHKKALIVIVLAGTFLILNTIIAYAQSDSLPHPQIVFTGKSDVIINGQEWTHYRLIIENKNDYRSELFETAPDLPPCGKNTSASRSWVSIYTQSGRSLRILRHKSLSRTK